MQMNKRLDVFLDMFHMVRGSTEDKLAFTQQFYREAEEVAKMKKFSTRIEEQIRKEIQKFALENETDEVNDWLLQVKQANMDEMADKTNILLASNLQHMKRHARMGVQIGKLRRYDANSCEHKRHVNTKIKELVKQEDDVDRYMDKILDLRRAQEYEGIGNREEQKKLAGLFMACQMS